MIKRNLLSVMSVNNVFLVCCFPSSGLYLCKARSQLLAPHSSTGVHGKSHGRRSLVGCSPWGHEESDTTE